MRVVENVEKIMVLRNYIDLPSLCRESPMVPDLKTDRVDDVTERSALTLRALRYRLVFTGSVDRLVRSLTTVLEPNYILIM